jgi:hypothetical protein
VTSRRGRAARTRARVGARALAPALMLLAAASCGGTRATLLEGIDAGSPPSANLRVDAFLIRAVATCAVGSPCGAADPAQCFSLNDATSTRASFAIAGLRFVPPSDPQAQPGAAGNDQVACFHVSMDDATWNAASQRLDGLRAQVFQASGGDINLDLRVHDVPAIDAGFVVFHTGLFLQPSTLAAIGLPLINRETDFTFAITGASDAATGLAPELVACEGSNWPSQGVLGASTYSWLAMAPACARADVFLRTWLNQVSLSRRDITLAPELYGGSYPACGRGDPDPTRWFPAVDDCTTDPDVVTCGQAACPDVAAFYAHILAAHWPRGRAFDGNYCDDGRIDFDETAVDRGGVCDLIGR